jgi:hypothetical protein
VCAILIRKDINIHIRSKLFRKERLWKYENYLYIQLAIWSVFLTAAIYSILLVLRFAVSFSSNLFFSNLSMIWSKRFDVLVQNNPELTQYITFHERMSSSIIGLSSELKEIALEMTSKITAFLLPMALVTMAFIITSYFFYMRYIRGSKWLYSTMLLGSINAIFSLFYRFLLKGVENPLLITAILTIAGSLSLKIFKSFSMRWWANICPNPKCGNAKRITSKYCPGCGTRMDKARIVRKR